MIKKKTRKDQRKEIEQRKASMTSKPWINKRNASVLGYSGNLGEFFPLL